MSVPYHRLFRVDPRYRWWRPLVALAVFLGFYLATQIVLAVAYFVPIGARGGPGALSDFSRKLQDDALSTADPVVFSLTLVSLIVLLPSIMIAVKLARLGPFGQLSSVRLRFRWRWMLACLLPLLVLAVIMVVVQLWGAVVIDGGVRWNTAELGRPTVHGTTLLVAIVMIVVGVPFQAAAEEYVFRGYVMQTVGSWIHNRVVGIVVAIAVSTATFAVLHVPNGYNVWGILDVGSFGLVAAIIVWRTGGLEATVLQHALNNIVIFLFQAPGWSKLDPNGSQGSAGSALLTLATSLAYWGMIEVMARWTGLVRRRPGREVPRFRGDAPRWSGTTTEGWSGAPALSGSASGVPVGGWSVDDTDTAGRPVDGSTGVGPRP